MIQRKFFIKGKKKKKIKWSSKNWQCRVVWKPHKTNEQRLKSGASQDTSSCWASVHTADCDPWTKIQKDKSEEKKISLLILCQSVLLLSILGDYSSVSFLSTCWQPAPINTYSCFLVFLSPLFFILKPSLSQIRVSDSKKITCHCNRDF